MPPALEAQSLNHWTAREVPDHSSFENCLVLSFAQLTSYLECLFFVCNSFLVVVLVGIVFDIFFRNFPCLLLSGQYTHIYQI